MGEPKVPSEAVDAPIARRPGHPQERQPEPVANAHWIVPDRQRTDAKVLKGYERDQLTATFGTAHPPRGISGMIRRAAYEIPDYRVRHWLLLIFADRVDAVEGSLIRGAKSPGTWLIAAGLGVGALTWMRFRKPPTRIQRLVSRLTP
jgi:hypothetical protein